MNIIYSRIFKLLLILLVLFNLILASCNPVIMGSLQQVTECEGIEQCPGDLVCQSGICLSNIDGSCTSDSHCVSSSACIDNICMSNQEIAQIAELNETRSVKLSLFAQCNHTDILTGVNYLLIKVTDDLQNTYLEKVYDFNSSKMQITEELPQREKIIVLIESYKENPGVLEGNEPVAKGIRGPVNLKKGIIINELSVKLKKSDEDYFDRDINTKCTKIQEKRYGHTTTLLPDGRVIIMGGAKRVNRLEHNAVLIDPETITKNVEIYNPDNGTVTELANTMIKRRAFHTATYLPSNGKILITGGISNIDSDFITLINAEYFDPNTNTFELLPDTAKMNSQRAHHSANYDEQTNTVVIIGGVISDSYDSAILQNEYLNTIEIFEVNNNKFSTNHDVKLNTARGKHTANYVSLLADDKTINVIAIVGGESSAKVLSSVEIYKVETKSFISGSMFNINYNRVNHTVTNIGNGKLLVSGGYSFNDYIYAQDNAELIDLLAQNPAKGSFYLMESRADHKAVRVGSRVYMVGGINYNGKMVQEIEYVEIEDEISMFKGEYYYYNSKQSYLSQGFMGAGSVKIAEGSFLFIGGIISQNSNLIPWSSVVHFNIEQ